MLHRYISVFFAAGKDGLLFAELAEDFDGGHQGETDEGKTYRPADLIAAGALDLGQCFRVAPWPDLYERADDEAGKDNEGLLVPAGKKPVKKLAESQDHPIPTKHLRWKQRL